MKLRYEKTDARNADVCFWMSCCSLFPTGGEQGGSLGPGLLLALSGLADLRLEVLLIVLSLTLLSGKDDIEDQSRAGDAAGGHAAQGGDHHAAQHGLGEQGQQVVSSVEWAVLVMRQFFISSQ